MIYWHKVTRMLIAAIAGVLACLCLLPLSAAAQGSPPPLPLPDVTLYGKITQRGEVLAEGTVKALLPDGMAVTAAIGPINGTDYNYALVIPLYMTGTQTLARTPGGALTGDSIDLFVNDQPAFYQDGATQLTMSQLKILSQQPAKTAAGRSYELNLSTGGPESYLMGDVNANGQRNSADAMLALKYDIGLIHGVTNFPPGPNTVYLPLCDIVANGRCDSSDALRILQCDVGRSDISCPTDRIPRGVQLTSVPVDGATVRLQMVMSHEVDSNEIGVRVELSDPVGQVGAASLELHYDAAVLRVIMCSDNPTDHFDLVTCNPDYTPGVVRFSAVVVDGKGADSVALVEVRFERIEATGDDLASLFSLVVNGLYDGESNDMAWSSPDSESPAVTNLIYLPALSSQTASTVGTAENVETPSSTETTMAHNLYLPAISGTGVTAAEAVDVDIPDDVDAESIPGPLLVEEGEGEAGGEIQLPSPTPIVKPEDEEAGAETAPAHLLYLPLVDE
ncbi:MAG: hypothetical protein KF893_03120 [Caldilineaceae bacterium]|nr:hypothetical protein [Caldilineaceae bacterium]